MSRKSILIVDDDPDHCEMLQEYLTADGYEVEACGDGDTALEKVRAGNFDIVLLDILMPGKDGIEVCREIRRFSSVPVIFLTAKGEEVDRVLGLELGGDDYVAKPFSPRELAARIKAVMRRTAREAAREQEKVILQGLTVNGASREVTVGKGERVPLTPKEFDLLWLLVRHPGRVFSRAELLSEVWGHTEYYGCERTVDTHIKQLRKKIFTRPEVPHRISTVWGVGYKFEPAG